MKQNQSIQRIGKISGSNRIQISQAARDGSSYQEIEGVEDSSDIVIDQVQAPTDVHDEETMVDLLLQNMQDFLAAVESLTTTNSELTSVSNEIRHTLADLNSKKSNVETKLKLTIPILPSIIAIEHTYKIEALTKNARKGSTSIYQLFQNAKMLLMKRNSVADESKALPPPHE